MDELDYAELPLTPAARERLKSLDKKLREGFWRSSNQARKRFGSSSQLRDQIMVLAEFSAQTAVRNYWACLGDSGPSADAAANHLRIYATFAASEVREAMLQQVIGRFELTRLLPREDNIDAVAEKMCEDLIEQTRGKIGSLEEQHGQMDFKEFSETARGRIKIVELQCAADLQKNLEGKWTRLRDHKSSQYRLLPNSSEDFFYNPLWEYTRAFVNQIAGEYFAAVDGPEFVTILKNELLPEILQSVTGAWRKAVDNSLDATGFKFAIIKGMSSWNREGVRAIDFSARLRAALQPAINEWERRAEDRLIQRQIIRPCPTEPASHVGRNEENTADVEARSIDSGSDPEKLAHSARLFVCPRLDTLVQRHPPEMLELDELFDRLEHPKIKEFPNEQAASDFYDQNLGSHTPPVYRCARHDHSGAPFTGTRFYQYQTKPSNKPLAPAMNFVLKNPVSCMLAKDWRFRTIEGNVNEKPSHRSVWRHPQQPDVELLEALYDFESELYRVHSSLDLDALKDFWCSFEVHVHLTKHALKMQRYGREYARPVSEALVYVREHLALYVDEVLTSTAAPPDQTEGKVEATPRKQRGRPTETSDELKKNAPGVQGGVGPTKAEAIAARAARRQAVVNPILQRKRWKPGRLVTKAGLGKNSVYEYLDGTRSKITGENRKAIAEALDLSEEQLPD